MNSHFFNLSKAADSITFPIGQRSRVLAATIGSVLARQCALPTSQVESATSYFTSTHGLATRGVLSDANEGLVFDLTYAMEVTRTLWLVRYYAAHPQLFTVYDESRSFMDMITGASQHVSQEMGELLENNKKTIVHLIPEVTAALVSLSLSKNT